MPTPEGHGAGAVVTQEERSCFVEAVRNGAIVPDATQVAYHFEGWLDKDVVDMLLEASSDPSEAVSALASMSPAAQVNANPAADTAKTKEPAASMSNKTAFRGGAAMEESGRRRQAMTLEAIRAQKASSAALGPTAVGGEATDVGCDVGAAAGGGGGGGGDGNVNVTNNAELEKVAAFIASYAGEQDAAAQSASAAVKPPQSPFLVPRGVAVPSTRKVQLVIATTAEKMVEMPGFEAFMKMEHGRDALFRFLETDHALHSYYLLAKKHVQEAVMKGGKAKGACSPVTRKPSIPKTEDPDVQEIMRMLGGSGP